MEHCFKVSGTPLSVFFYIKWRRDKILQHGGGCLPELASEVTSEFIIFKFLAI